MKSINASFVGTTLATVLGTAYFICDDNRYHLWTLQTRIFLLGGAAAVLVCYSVIWYFHENESGAGEFVTNNPRVEYAIMILGHFLLGLGLAAVGSHFGAFLSLFLAFNLVSLVWTIKFANSERRLFVHECVNCLACVIYVAVAFVLYGYADEFESTFAAMSTDQKSFEVRRQHLLGEITDINTFLGFVVGIVVLNLCVLVANRVSRESGGGEVHSNESRVETTSTGDQADD